MLGQSARVYLTALVLTLVMAEQLDWIQGYTGLSPLASAIIIKDRLIPAIGELREGLARKQEEFADIVKIGRTSLL